MNRYLKNIIIIFAIISSMIQCLYIYKYEKLENQEKEATSIVYPTMTLSDFNRELSSLEKKNIVSAENINNNWHIKVKIEGNKEFIFKELNKLYMYNLGEFSVNHSGEGTILIVELSEKMQL